MCSKEFDPEENMFDWRVVAKKHAAYRAKRLFLRMNAFKLFMHIHTFSVTYTYIHYAYTYAYTYTYTYLNIQGKRCC